MLQRFCIVGGGFQNKGAEAMLLTTVQAIRRRRPQAVIAARIPREDFAAARAEGIRPLSIGEDGLLRKFMSKVKTATMIAEGTCLIDISGFQFGDAWSSHIAQRRAATVRRFVRAGNPVFFLSQAWGPFEKKPRLADATRNMLEQATLSFVRDKQSEQAVQQLAPKAAVRFAHDLAWNFPAGDADTAARRLVDVGLDPAKRPLTVCVTPNQRVYERSAGRGADNGHVKLLSLMVNRLVRKHNAQVLLLGHELRPVGSTIKDDRHLCELVMKTLDPGLPVVHLNAVYSAADLKALIGRCQLVISSRYHALIAALSQTIAVGTAGWSHKYTELLEETGGGLSFSESDPEATSLEKLDHLVTHREQFVGQLQRRVPGIQQNSREALDLVFDQIVRRYSKSA